jgi:NAD(P)H-nitrite reductase large subunit
LFVSHVFEKKRKANLQAKRVNKKNEKRQKKLNKREKKQKKQKREEIKGLKTFQNVAKNFFLKLGSSSCKMDAKIYFTCSASFRYETKDALQEMH